MVEHILTRSSMTYRIKSLLNRLNFQESIKLTWSVSKSLTLTTLILLVLENVFWLGSIYMLKKLVDVVAMPDYADRREELMQAIVISGVISIVYACIRSLSGYFSELQATKVNHFIDRKIHAHTLQLDYAFYETPEYLDILKRAREAGVDKPYAVVRSLFDIVKNVITLASIGWILISIDWLLLPLLALFVLPILIGRILFSNRGFMLYMKNTGLERQAHYLSSLMTADSFAKEIRTFSLGKYLQSKYMKIKDDLMDQQLSLSRKRTINELLTTGLGTTAFFAITAYIVFGTLNGQTSVGDIAVFLVIFPQSYSIMQALVAAITALYQNNMYVAHIFELFNLKPHIENRISQASLADGMGDEGLVMQNVSFTYPHNKDAALQNISLHIPPGKIVAIVGMNGAGKTTLIKLLCKLYEPSSGIISFGGNDIRQYSASQYRKQISVVFQDFVRYNLTVKENIWFGDIDKELSADAVKRAAINAGAADFIEKFALKYDTVLGRLFDEGHEISIGQWQKIAIARAFYSRSSLIILDEATSALDAIAETELFNSFRSRIGQRSALVISHRLSTIKQADYIYVMSDKQIVESGTHDELMLLDGKYASIYENTKDKTKVAIPKPI
jgi:ATP-binding cassette, subfamily B, bacterial